MKSVEIQSKTIDEAITKGCEELGVGIDEVDFDVLDEGGMFRKMKVKITLKAKEEAKPKAEKPEEKKPVVKREEPKEERSVAEPVAEVVKGKAEEFEIVGEGRKQRPPREPRPERPVTEFNEASPKFVKTLEFAKQFFAALDEKLTITTSHNDREYIIEVHGEDVSRLIGKEGKTLMAINTIVSSIAINHSNGEGRRVIVDIEGYREKRKASLVELAKRKAEWVKESGKTVRLEPMPARERVIIHTTLQDMEGIRTRSDGDEPNRFLIIEPSAR